MFYLETKNRSYCCGCRACEQICPKSCIIMNDDEEGFYYPIKDEELCINCNLCKSVCPNVNKDKLSEDNGDFSFYPKAYMVIHKDESTLDNSSSGGAFSTIVETYCNENFIVFGVELDENLNAIHSYTETIAGIEKYRKSKYVQSDIGDSYKKAEEFLKVGKKVLFTGTPCQIAGLRLYLKREYDNLLCVDIVCHGVPSQKVFNYYLNYMQKKYKGVIKSYI